MTQKPPQVIDLSHWNPTPDWATLKANGIVGVILKATQGTEYIDDTFASRVNDAYDAGLFVAAYHFLEGGDIEAQMLHFVNVVAPFPIDRLCVDHEADATLDELKQAVAYLCDLTDCSLTIYSGHTIKEQLGGGYDPFLSENTDLWLAQYSESAEWPSETWPEWALWQYTDKLTIGGCSQPVDGNIWAGSTADLKRWFYPTYREPQPEEPRQAVDIDIVMTGDVEISITINGVTWRETE